MLRSGEKVTSLKKISFFSGGRGSDDSSFPIWLVGDESRYTGSSWIESWDSSVKKLYKCTAVSWSRLILIGWTETRTLASKLTQSEFWSGCKSKTLNNTAGDRFGPNWWRSRDKSLLNNECSKWSTTSNSSIVAANLALTRLSKIFYSRFRWLENKQLKNNRDEYNTQQFLGCWVV